MRMLLVADNPSDLLDLERRFLREGHEVMWAQDVVDSARLRLWADRVILCAAAMGTRPLTSRAS